MGTRCDGCFLDERTFGVELELGVVGHAPEEVASLLGVPYYEYNSEQHKDTSKGWKVVEDITISCNESKACFPMEIVSPVLAGAAGLAEVTSFVDSIPDQGYHVLNPTMGLHVHVGVQDLSLEQRKSVVAHVLFFEPGLDLLPPVRSDPKGGWCVSNWAHARRPLGDVAALLAGCSTLDCLVNLMHPKLAIEGQYFEPASMALPVLGESGRYRYMKVSIMHLAERGRSTKPTVEFRAHVASSDSVVVNKWASLLVQLVDRAAKSPLPTAEDFALSPREKLRRLFAMVNDAELTAHYSKLLTIF